MCVCVCVCAHAHELMRPRELMLMPPCVHTYAPIVFLIMLIYNLELNLLAFPLKMFILFSNIL